MRGERMAGPVILVTGTHAEAASLPNHAGLLVIAGGGDAAGLAGKLAAAAPGAAGIISYGTAGALAPGLTVGEWIIGVGLAGGAAAPCDPRWVAALARCLPAARAGLVFADCRLLATAALKAEARRTGAIAVDMESHLAGTAARDADVPFAVLRCISDHAEALLPPAIAVAMRPDGRLDYGAMARSVMRQPGQVPALVGAIRGFAGAFRVLRREGSVLNGTRLGFDAR